MVKSLLNRVVWKHLCSYEILVAYTWSYFLCKPAKQFWRLPAINGYISFQLSFSFCFFLFSPHSLTLALLAI